MTEIRKDPINQHWVIVSEERSRRPSDFSRLEEMAPLQPWDEACPFCPGNEEKTPPEVFKSHCGEPSWQVRVVPNKYPILSAEGCPSSGTELLERHGGSGANEVIIETPLHHLRMSEYSFEQMTSVVEAYVQRLKHHLSDSKIAYVQLFKNDGKAAGASLAHPHAQLVALPLIPPVIVNELTNTDCFYQRRQENLFEALIDAEFKQRVRVVECSEDFIVIAPYASRFPYELHLYPRWASSDFTEMNAKQINALCQIFQHTLKRLDHLLDCPPFNWCLHTLPNPKFLSEMDQSSQLYRWHIEIIPRLNFWAGFEWGSGMILNPVLPEKAAKALREVNLLPTPSQAHP